MRLTEDQASALRAYLAARYRDGLPTAVAAVAADLAAAGVTLERDDIADACARVPFIPAPQSARAAVENRSRIDEKLTAAVMASPPKNGHSRSGRR